MKGLLVSASTLLLLGAIIAASWHGLGGSVAHADPTLVLGIDMDPTGNVCTGPAGQGETCDIPSVEHCIEISSTEGTSFDIDTFVTGLTNGFCAHTYDLEFPDTTTGANLTMTSEIELQAAVNLIMQAPGSAPLVSSDSVPDPTSPHASTVSDFGTCEDSTWTRGVLVRHRFTIGAGGATPGIYTFIFTPDSWAIIDFFGAAYTVDDVWDGNYWPYQYGSLAIDLGCPTAPGPVGGIAEYPDVADSALGAADSSGDPSFPLYAALAGSLGAALVTLIAGAWYVSRRWVA